VAEIFQQERAIPSTVEFVDIAGLVRGASQGEGLGNQFLAAIREVDAILHVVRCFPDPDIAHVENSLDPVRDVEIVEMELILADLGTVERRREKAKSALKGHTKEAQEEAALLERLSAHLSAGKPARAMGEELIPLDLHLLTDKPEVYLANLSENAPNREECAAPLAAAVTGPVIVETAKLEADLAELEEGERAAFIAELNLEATGLEKVVRACYQALDLVMFYTGVGAEARAWSVPRGTHLGPAAGRIHSDMERGFIRAEVLDFAALDALGSWQEAHRAGKVRTEGRDYVVQDGDVVWVKFHA
jgi:hypothetical protein